MIKVCENNECTRKGVEYDDSLTRCPFCEQVLTSSAEVSDGSFENTQIETIALIDMNRKSIEIPLSGCVISRTSALGDSIFNHKWISDPHCRLFIRDSILFVEDIGDSLEGSTNGTSINGEERIPKDTPTPLADKDRLVIAHLKFDVEIKYALVQNPVVSASIEETLIWVVVCPECTKWHKVSAPSERVANCVGCHDPDYAKEIAKVEARQRSETEWKLRE
jgi:hypothetical protein